MYWYETEHQYKQFSYEKNVWLLVVRLVRMRENDSDIKIQSSWFVQYKSFFALEETGIKLHLLDNC